MRIHRFDRLLLLALATCAITWSLVGVAAAQPADARPAGPGTAAGHPPTIGDHSVPDPRQVDAVLADLKRDRSTTIANGDHSVPNPRQVDAVLADLKRDRETTSATAPSVANSDTETIALVISIVAILTALGAVTLTVTRSRGRVLGT